MEYPSGDRHRPFHHHHRRHEEENDEHDLGRPPFGEGDRYPLPFTDEQRYPTSRHEDYPPPGLSDPYSREEERYPTNPTYQREDYPPPGQRYPPPGLSDAYSREEERYPSQGGAPYGDHGSVRHVAHQVFDERPGGHGGYAGGGGMGGHQVFDERPSYATSGYVQHVSHQVLDERPGGHGGYVGGGGMGGHQMFDERPSYATSGYVQHISHQVHDERPGGHGGQSDLYGGGVGYSQEVGGEGGLESRMKTVRVFTKAAEGFSLTIRDGEVVLAPADSSDEYQHWIKDQKYCTKVKDEEGFPSFSLVNKATGQAIMHSIGETQPVRLVPHDPGHLDTSVLWTESPDMGDNYHCIRMVNNIRLNFDAFHGDKNHGGVRDGTPIVLWEWLQGENQQWRIVPY